MSLLKAAADVLSIPTLSATPQWLSAAIQRAMGEDGTFSGIKSHIRPEKFMGRLLIGLRRSDAIAMKGVCGVVVLPMAFWPEADR